MLFSNSEVIFTTIMDKTSENKINRKYFIAALILTVLLAVAGIMQMNIPADRSKVPPSYLGNMLVTIDQIAAFTYNDLSVDETIITKSLFEAGQYEQAMLWQQFLEQRRAKR